MDAAARIREGALPLRIETVSSEAGFVELLETGPPRAVAEAEDGPVDAAAPEA